MKRVNRKIKLWLATALLGLIAPFSTNAQDILNCDFEDATENANWIVGVGQNIATKWTIGSAVHNGTGTQALYVSDSNGTANHYRNTNTSCFARRLITITDSGYYDFEYDWKAQGYSTTYYMRAALVPANLTQPRDTTAIVSGLTATALPAGWISIDSTRLNLQGSTWQHKRYTVWVNPGQYYVTFYWRNSTSANYNPPAAIDNIVVRESQRCMPPLSINMLGSTSNTITYDIYPNDPTATYLLSYHDEYWDVDSTIEVMQFPYTITDVPHSRIIWVSVAKICSNADTSAFCPMFGRATECYQYTLPWNFGFESSSYWYSTSGTTTYPRWPTCWNALEGGSTTYNWRQYGSSSQTAGHNNSHYYWGFFGVLTTNAAQHDDYLITPEMNMTGDEVLSFWAKSSSNTATAAYHCRLRVAITDPTINDSNNIRRNFVDIPIPNNNGSRYFDFTGTTWQQFTVPIHCAPGVANLAFIVDTGSYTFYIDDIRLTTRSNCPDAVNPRVVSVKSDSVLLAWSDTSHNATTWDVYIGAPGFEIDTVIARTVNDTLVWIDNLNPNTSYEFMVTAYCSDGSAASPTSPMPFHTACTPITTLPYVQNFDGITGSTAGNANNLVNNINCWIGGHTAGSNYPHVFTTNHVSGANSLRFYANSANDCWAVLPLIDANLQSLQVSFNMFRYNSSSTSYTSTIQVGVVSNPSDMSTFDTVATIDLFSSAINQWYHQEVSLENYTGNGQYIAFKAPNGTSLSHAYNYAIIDDVVVGNLPTCRRPTELRDSAVTINSAIVTWNANAASRYMVAVSRTQNFNADTASHLTTTNNYINLSGLAPYTTYYVKVASICGNDTSNWSDQLQFTTLFSCVAGRTFVNAQVGRDTTLQSYFDFYSNTAAYSAYPYVMSQKIYTAEEIINAGVVTNNSIINGLSIRLNTTAAFNVNSLKIYLGETDQSAFATVADSIPMSNLRLVYSSTTEPFVYGWNEIIFDSAYTYSGRQNLVVVFERRTATGTAQFTYRSTTPAYATLVRYKSSATANMLTTRSYNRSIIKFNTCTVVPACAPVRNVSCSNISTDSVTVSWQSTATNFEIALVPQGTDPDSATAAMIHSATQSPARIGGLTANTFYDVYVRSVCSATELGAWSSRESIHTNCMALSIPYYEDFESYTGSGATGTAANHMSPCWYVDYTGTALYPYVCTTYANNSRNSARFYGTSSISDYAALPELNRPWRDIYLEFDLYSVTVNSQIVVGVMTDAQDITTFSPLDTLKNDLVSTWQRHRVMLNRYTGNGKHLAFYAHKNSTAYNAYIDNIAIDTLPNCGFVGTVTVANVTSSTVTLNWPAVNGAALGYEVRIEKDGSTNNLFYTTNTPSITVNNLSFGTNYRAFVRAICSTADTGAWTSRAASFTTDCQMISTLPYRNGFENYTTGTTAPVPNCFARFNDSPNATNYYPYIMKVATSAHSGTNYAYFFTAAGTTANANNIMLCTPQIDTTQLQMSNLQVSFYAKGTATGTHKVIVGLTSNPASLAAFTPFDTIDLTALYDEYTVPFTGATAAMGSRIAFYAKRISTAQYCYLDDIEITTIPTCPKPRNITRTTATAHSITLSWEETGSATSWEVEYTDSLNNVNRVVVNANPAIIGGLSAKSHYTVRVRSICSAGDTSEWSHPTTTTTRNCAGLISTTDNGSWTPNNFAVSGSNYRHTLSQVIITAAEMATGGNTISGMEFYTYSSDGDTTMTDAVIYMGNTSQSEFAATTSWIHVDTSASSTTFTKVYEGNLIYKQGWNVVAFNRDFVWDGQSNVVVVIKRDRGAKRIMAGSSYAVSPEPNSKYRLMYYQNDVTEPNITAPTQTGTRQTYRSVINLISCGGMCEVPFVTLNVQNNNVTANIQDCNVYEMSIKEASASMWDAPIIDSAATYQFNNLLPLTDYSIRVRQLCGSSQSEYAIFNFTTGELPCSVPDSIVITPIIGGVNVTFAPVTAEELWQAHVWNNVYDSVHTFASNNATLNLLQGEQMNIALRAVCDTATAVYSNYSDTVSVTTLSCDSVLNLTAVAGDTTATITWSAGANNATTWIVEYGMYGFVNGEGTRDTVNTTSIQLTGLESETHYDVYVMAMCDEVNGSNYVKTDFTTERLDVNNVESHTTVSLYPNPATNVTTVTIGGIEGSVSIDIVDLNGRIVAKHTVECNTNCTKTITLDQMAQGVYVVRVHGKSINTVRRLVVK